MREEHQGEELLEIHEAADFTIHHLLSPSSAVSGPLHEAKKLGGYLCVANAQGQPLLIVSCGDPDPEKVQLYLEFCQEKARRLAEHPEHVRSYESRDPDQKRYSGAVRAGDLIISFSGFFEELDEVVSAVLLWQAGAIEFNEIRVLLEGNSFLEVLSDADLKACSGE